MGEEWWWRGFCGWEKLTQVVASGHRLPDGDGCGSDRDDEHLVVACKKKKKINSVTNMELVDSEVGAAAGLLGYHGAGCEW